MKTQKFHNCNATIETYDNNVTVFRSYATAIVVTVGAHTYIRPNWRDYSRTTTQQVARYMREQTERYLTCDEITDEFVVDDETFFGALQQAR